MAKRPVFSPSEEPPFVQVEDAEFEFFPGFSAKQKHRTVGSLHAAHLAEKPEAAILEISSKSPSPLGAALSPFNLTISYEGRTSSVEAAFQGSKRFEGGGPYTDLLGVPARVAKRDPRLQESGELVGYEYLETEFPVFPRTYFYNWLYATALSQHPELAGPLLDYTAFTDIEFNPARSTNCQARAAATFVGLSRAGLLNEALESPESFLTVVYPGAQ